MVSRGHAQWDPEERLVHAEGRFGHIAEELAEAFEATFRKHGDKQAEALCIGCVMTAMRLATARIIGQHTPDSRDAARMLELLGDDLMDMAESVHLGASRLGISHKEVIATVTAKDFDPEAMHKRLERAA